MAGSIKTIPLQEVHILIHENCECVIFYMAVGFTVVMKLRILTWRGYPGLDGYPDIVTTVLRNEKGRRVNVRDRDVRTEVGFGVTQKSALKMEKVAMSKEMQAASQSWKSKETVCYLEPPEAPVDTLILAQ